MRIKALDGMSDNASITVLDAGGVEHPLRGVQSLRIQLVANNVIRVDATLVGMVLEIEAHEVQFSCGKCGRDIVPPPPKTVFL